MAEAVFRDLVRKRGWEDRIYVNSSGTGTWHIGEPPHYGTRTILDAHGIPYDGQRAKHLTAAEIRGYDYVIAMDRSNFSDLQAMGVPGDRIQLFTTYVPGQEGTDVPDPYYDGNFERVFDLVSVGAKNLLDRIAAEQGWNRE